MQTHTPHMHAQLRIAQHAEPIHMPCTSVMLFAPILH